MTSLREKFFQFAQQPHEELTHPNDKVLLIDGHNNFIRNYCASSAMNTNGDHCGGIAGFLLSLGATIRTLRPSRVVIVFDGPGGSKRRRAIYTDYKANRTPSKLNRKFGSNLTDEQKSMRRQMLGLTTMLKCLPVTVMAIDNVEADDVIAYLAQAVVERGGKAIIMSTDKDFLQLVDDNIHVWNPIKKEMYRAEKVVEHYGFHPHNFLLFRVVSGDESDNVPGVLGIKEKTLHKYFPELAEPTKQPLEFLFDAATRQTKDVKKPPVVLTRLLESRDLIERNQKLMDLHHVQMSGQTKISVIERFDAPIPKFSRTTLTKHLMTAKMIHLFPEFELWTRECFIPLQRFSPK